MYYVYIIKLEKGDGKKKYYIGYSGDLRRRLIEHKDGKVFFTKGKEPKLIYYEAYGSIKLAQKREKDLKKFGSAYSGLLKRISEI